MASTFEFFSQFTDGNPTLANFSAWCSDHGLTPPTAAQFDAVINPPASAEAALKQFVAGEKLKRLASKARRAGQSAPRTPRSVKRTPTLIRR